MRTLKAAHLCSITILAMLTLLTASSFAPVAHASSHRVPMVCRSYYFFEVIKVVNGSTIVKNLELDVPINVSLGNIVQSSRIVMSSGLVKRWIVDVSKPGLSYIVARVTICYPNTTWSLRLVRAFLSIPYLYKNYTIPTSLLRRYVGKPEPIILNVSNAFIAWLRNSGIPFAELSVGGLAYRAALFVYWIYIRYTPSAIPHSVEHTVKTRRGDCDDMSRVLTELLWHYGIPALMVYGFVILNLSKPFAGNLGGITFVMPNVGPHAFVVAYIPPFGWLSVDLLAGSYIIYPFIIVQVTNNTRVSQKEVNEFVELCLTLRGEEIAFVLPAQLVDDVATKIGIPREEMIKSIVSFVANFSEPYNLSIARIRGFVKEIAEINLSSVYRLLKLFGEPYPGFIAVARWRYGGEISLPR